MFVWSFLHLSWLEIHPGAKSSRLHRAARVPARLCVCVCAAFFRWGCVGNRYHLRDEQGGRGEDGSGSRQQMSNYHMIMRMVQKDEDEDEDEGVEAALLHLQQHGAF